MNEPLSRVIHAETLELIRVLLDASLTLALRGANTAALYLTGGSTGAAMMEWFCGLS